VDVMRWVLILKKLLVSQKILYYQTSKVKHDKGLEWVQLVEDKDDKIVIQHLLIVGKPTKPNIIKHWRQYWLFEDTDFYMFDANNKWNFIQKTKIKVAG
jgi:hypothetical protein